MTHALTPEMRRILAFLADHASGWISIMQLGLIRLLEADDFIAIPGLVERRLVEHDAKLAAVRITEAGRAALDKDDGK